MDPRGVFGEGVEELGRGDGTAVAAAGVLDGATVGLAEAPALIIPRAMTHAPVSVAASMR